MKTPDKGNMGVDCSTVVDQFPALICFKSTAERYSKIQNTISITPIRLSPVRRPRVPPLNKTGYYEKL